MSGFYDMYWTARILGLSLPEGVETQAADTVFKSKWTLHDGVIDQTKDWVEVNGIVQPPKNIYSGITVTGGLQWKQWTTSSNIVFYGGDPMYVEYAPAPPPPPIEKAQQTEVIIGWRAWDILDGGKVCLLKSVVQDDVWPASEPMKSEAVVYAQDCYYGIHAYKQEHSTHAYRSSDGVYGTVALWGTVIEHEDGYRAQYAYPQTIIVPAALGCGGRVARALAATYGCEVRRGE